MDNFLTFWKQDFLIKFTFVICTALNYFAWIIIIDGYDPMIHYGPCSDSIFSVLLMSLPPIIFGVSTRYRKYYFIYLLFIILWFLINIFIFVDMKL